MKIFRFPVILAIVLTLLFAPLAAATRQKYYLEKFELAQLQVWHVYKDSCGFHALVLDPERLLHDVRVASYIGGMDGKIVGIDFSGLDITELMPDGEGGWKEVSRRLENPSHEYDKQAYEAAERKQ